MKWCHSLIVCIIVKAHLALIISFIKSKLEKPVTTETLFENSLFGLNQGALFTQLGGKNTFEAAPDILGQTQGYTSAVFFVETLVPSGTETRLTNALAMITSLMLLTMMSTKITHSNMGCMTNHFLYNQRNTWNGCNNHFTPNLSLSLITTHTLNLPMMKVASR